MSYYEHLSLLIGFIYEKLEFKDIINKLGGLKFKSLQKKLITE